MNTPTKATNAGDKPAEQVLNTQSTKPVAPGVASVADPDHSKTGEKLPAKAVDNTDGPKSAADLEFEKALAEKDHILSVQDQKAIDAAHGDSPEIERGDKSYIGAAAHSTHDSLFSDMRTIQERDQGIRPRIERFCEDYENPVAIITKLVRDVPADTPDEHIVWGASGHKLRMGHLRALVMGVGPR